MLISCVRLLYILTEEICKARSTSKDRCRGAAARAYLAQCNYWDRQFHKAYTSRLPVITALLRRAGFYKDGIYVTMFLQ